MTMMVKMSLTLAHLLSISWVVTSYTPILQHPITTSPSFTSTRMYGWGVPSNRGSSKPNIGPLSYATAEQEIPLESGFQQRMRRLVFGGEQSQKQPTQQEDRSRPRPTQPSRVKVLPPNVMIVETLADYKRVIVAAQEQEKIVVVRFYAPWCRACKAVEPLFYRMAKEFPNVLFVDVPATEHNANLHQGLGVPSLPYGHIYHPHGGLVEESQLTRKFVSDFARRVSSYELGICDLQDVGDVTCPYSSS